MVVTCGLVRSGCFLHFQGGDIHYSADTPAAPTWGEIRNQWARTGWERGPLGYPLAPETCTSSSSCTQTYQGGAISWTATGGARVVVP